MANTEPLRTISDRFDISVSSTFRVIRRVTKWILTKLDNVIQWQQTDNAVMRACEGLRSKKIYPTFWGRLIVHISICIAKPPENSADYCNRKKYF